MNSQADREIEMLEQELEECHDPVERRSIMMAIRDIEREERDHDRWQHEGNERGWR